MTTMVLLPKRSLLRALLITSPLILIGLFVSLKPSSEPFEDDDVTGRGWSKTPAPRTHGNWWEGIHRGTNWNPLDWVNSPVLKEEALDGDRDGWINFDEELKWTKYEGGEFIPLVISKYSLPIIYQAWQASRYFPTYM